MRTLFLLALCLLLVAHPFCKISSVRAEDADPEDDYEDDDDSGEPAGDGEIPEGNDGDVVAFTSDGLKDALKSHKYMMVEFYAPWCGHCKTLAPEYRKAAAELKEHGVLLGKVDATKEKEAAEENKVEGYPSLFFAVDGVLKTYSGGRTAPEIVSWIKKRIGLGVTTFSSADLAKVEALRAKAAAICVAYVADLEGPDATAFGKASTDVEGVELVKTADADVAKAFGLDTSKTPALALIKNEEEKFVTFDGSFVAEELVSFINANKLPLIITFSQEVTQTIFGGDIKKQVMVMSLSETYLKSLPAFSAVAKQFKGQVLFIFVNSSDEET